MNFILFRLLRATRIKRTVLLGAPSFRWRMRVPVGSAGGKEICRNGVLNRGYTEFLLNNLSFEKGDVAIDCGAHIGWYSLLLDRMVRGGGEYSPSNQTAGTMNVSRRMWRATKRAQSRPCRKAYPTKSKQKRCS